MIDDISDVGGSWESSHRCGLDIYGLMGGRWWRVCVNHKDR